MHEFPKVLIVNGEPLSDVSATGITVSNLFGDWPRDSISQIYTANLPTNPDKFKFSSRLTARDLLPFAFLARRTRGDTRVAVKAEAGVPNKAPRKKNIRTKLQYGSAPLLDFLPYHLPAAVAKQIEEFQPDVIYSLLGNIRITRLVHELGRRLRVPIVPHFMDDWLATYSVPDKSTGTRLHREVLNWTVRRLFERVPFGMAIGDLMAEEYSRKFGCDFLPFMNPVAEILDGKKFVRDSKKPLVFVYVGGLHLRRDQAILDLIDILSNINQSFFVAKLLIYAPESDKEKAVQLAEISPFVQYCGSVAASEIAETLKGCDVAIHVESTEPNVARYTRFSVSTKIPQYLAGGLPILAYGPAASASSLYISDSKVGISVNGGDKSVLLSTVKRLVADDSWRKELGLAALNLAKERHLSEHVRSAFKTALSRAVLVERRGLN
ncbi:hypothetical protein [Variovorax paradoxus]|uniref:hypothetical protein n=1 Tax=Variovorax paradoxus TaxID=34073 RepID=UPI003ECFD2B1